MADDTPENAAENGTEVERIWRPIVLPFVDRIAAAVKLNEDITHAGEEAARVSFLLLEMATKLDAAIQKSGTVSADGDTSPWKNLIERNIIQFYMGATPDMSVTHNPRGAAATAMLMMEMAVRLDIAISDGLAPRPDEETLQKLTIPAIAESAPQKGLSFEPR